MRNAMQNAVHIINGNTVMIEVPAEKGRVHLEGSGDIHAYVSTDASTYQEVQHAEAFVNGKCEFPIAAFVGDHIKLTATSITLCNINWVYETGDGRGRA